MRRRSFLIDTSRCAAAGLAVTSGAGCQTIMGLLRTQLEDPRVSIKGMRVREMGLTTIGTTFDVELFNPNDVGLTLAGIDYTLLVDEKKIAEGQSEGEVPIPAQQSAPATLNVDFALGDSGPAILRVLQREKLAYVLDAVAKIGTEDVHLRVPMTSEGELVLPKPPRFSVRDVEFPELSTHGLQARVLCSVHNPNNFDIPIDSFRVEVTLNGHTILKNQAIEGVTLHALHASDVPVDFEFGLDELGLSLSALLEKPEISWKVLFELVSGQHALPFSSEGQVKLAEHRLRRLIQQEERQRLVAHPPDPARAG